jgi:hypothetical protein
MILARVDLLLEPTYTRLIETYYDKQVSAVETKRRVLIDDFHMR